MRRPLLWIELALGAAVAAGVWVQVYLIAAHLFGAADALDLHATVGEIVRGLATLAFLAALGAWWRRWDQIGRAFALAVLVSVQIAFTGSDEWVGGLHGVLALAVLVLAVFVVKGNAEELGLTGRRDADAGGAPTRPLP